MTCLYMTSYLLLCWIASGVQAVGSSSRYSPTNDAKCKVVLIPTLTIPKCIIFTRSAKKRFPPPCLMFLCLCVLSGSSVLQPDPKLFEH